MAKSSPEQVAHSSRFSTFVNAPIARIIIVAIAVGVVVAAQAVYKHYHPNKYDAARKAADTFLTAYTNCDATTAARYYKPFQNNASAILAYQQQCKKGAIHFTYNSTSAKTATTITYIYDAAQTGGQPVKFYVEMQTDKAGKAWAIYTVNPVQSNAGSSSSNATTQGTTTVQ